jgi:hypothetical protein
VPTAVRVAAPLLAEPEYPAVPASWLQDNAADVLRGGPRPAAAKHIRDRPAPADQMREAPAREVPGLRVAAPINGRFTGGFDTAGLQEAKALLKELS